METFEEVFDEVVRQEVILRCDKNITPTNLYVSEDVYETIREFVVSLGYISEFDNKRMLNGFDVFKVVGTTNHIKVC